MDEATNAAPAVRRSIDRRTVMIRAGLTGAATVWATPLVQSLNMSSASATGSPPPDGGGGGGGQTGTVTGTVVDATTAAAIQGAVVSVVGGGSGTTDASGMYSIPDVPAGDVTLNASATGYASATLVVTVPDGGSATANFALSTLGSALRAVLSWGTQPTDLDLHMSGPDGNGGRFHCAFYDAHPTDFVTLDVDDVTSEGPETISITVSALEGGTFVDGSYHVWVHNFSTSPEFDVSNGRVDLFGLSSQLGQFLVANATGNPADDIWQVVTFDVATNGAVSNVAAQQILVAGNASSVF
jgi:hypothetical protein